MESRSIGFEIKKLDNMISRLIRKDTKLKEGFSLSHVQVKILFYLLSNMDYPIYQRDIEKFLSVRRSTVSGILHTMEKNQFIQKIDSKEDARLRQIVLTDKVLEKAKNLKEKVDYFDQLLGKDISKKELDLFFHIIDKIKENILKEDLKDV